MCLVCLISINGMRLFTISLIMSSMMSNCGKKSNGMKKSRHIQQIWQEFGRNIYGGELPDELYLVTGQYNAFVKAFEEFGYDVTAEVDTTAKLYHMVFNPDKPQVLEFE